MRRYITQEHTIAGSAVEFVEEFEWALRSLDQEQSQSILDVVFADQRLVRSGNLPFQHKLYLEIFTIPLFP